MNTYNFECVIEFQYLGNNITNNNEMGSEIRTQMNKDNKYFERTTKIIVAV